MLSVADIPLAGTHFTGIIGIVFWKGNMELEVRLLEQNAHPLRAPKQGAMVRTIHENLVCKAFYRFRNNGVTQFAFETDKASFEFEY